MKNDTTLFATLGRRLRRYGPGCLLVLLIALLWMRSSLVYAAPLQQTVPPPTSTPETDPVPTATSVPDNNDDDDDDDDDDDNDNAPAPTNTSVPQSEQPTAAPQAEQPTAVPQSPTVEGPTGMVIVARLNVRQGPGTNFAVIGTLTNGTTVTVLSRNDVGDWWRVCCVGGTSQEGWVAAQYIQPNFDLGQATTLIPVDGALPEAPTATPTLVPGVVPTVTTTSPVAQLALQVQQAPPYVWQEQVITLTYQIENRSEVAATNLEVRNELPAELTFISASPLTAGEFMTETTEVGRTVLVMRWPELQAGATATADIQVQVGLQMINGSVLDNLAVATADDVQPVTAGISIGMPPATLPDFR